MTLLKGGRVNDPQSGMDAVADILVEDGRILAIGQSPIPSAGEIVHCTGLVVAPGLIDTHVHFREPGFPHKETIATGAGAAGRGGFTTVVCMANTNPPVDTPQRLAQNLLAARSTGIRVLQAACVSVGMAGKTLTDMEALAAAGAAGFTDDGIPLTDPALVRDAMERARKLDKPVSLHEEEPSLLYGSGFHHGAVAKQLGLPAAPAVAEDALVARDCMLALHTGARVVIQHISSAAAVEMVRTARRLGADVHAEATPHHFSLTQEAVMEHGALAKMNPPLRTEADRQAIWEGLADGTIGIIATDHAPHTSDEKSLPLKQAPSGIIGLETSLALGITNLVEPGILTLPELLRKMTALPAACYRLDAGNIREGGPADLTVFDPQERWTVGSFASKSRNSPFVGQTLRGKVRYTICGGSIVYDSGKER